MIRISVSEEGQPPRLMTFNRASVTLGRGEACDLRLGGKGVSGEHCRISQVAGGYRVDDLGSTNGTYVNRRRITGSQMITAHDEVVIASYVVRMVEDAMPLAVTGQVAFGITTSGPQPTATAPGPAQTAGFAPPAPVGFPAPPVAHPDAVVPGPAPGIATTGPSPRSRVTPSSTAIPSGGALDDAAWQREWTRIDRLTSEWIASRRDRSKLLRGDKLAHARRWLAQGRGRNPAPKREHRDFIGAAMSAANLRLARNVALGGIALGGLVVAGVRLVPQEVAKLERTTQEIALIPSVETPPTAVNPCEAADALLERMTRLEADEPETAARIAIAALRKIPGRRDTAARGCGAEAALRRTTEGLLGRPLPGHDGAVVVAVVSPDGRYAVTAEDGATSDAARLWDLEAVGAARPTMLRGSGPPIRAAAFSGDGRLVVTADEDRVVRWDLSSGQMPPSSQILEAPVSGVTSIAVSFDGRFVLAGGRSGRAQLFDATKPTSRGLSLEHHVAGINAVELAPDGSRALSVSDDATAVVWRLAGGAVSGAPTVLEGHIGAVLSGTMSSDGRWVLTGGSDNRGRLWDLSQRNPSAKSRILEGHTEAVRNVAISPDDRYAVTASLDDHLAVWKLFVADPGLSSAKDDRATADLTALLVRGPATGAAEKAARPQIAFTGSIDGRVRMLELEGTDTKLAGNELEGNPGGVMSLGVDRAGVVAVSGGRDGSAFAYDAEEVGGSGLALIGRGHTGQVLDVGVAAGGTRVLTGAADGTARIWDATKVERLREIAVLRGHAGPVRAVAVGPEGRYGATGGEDGIVRLWDLGREDPGAIHRQLVGHEGDVNDLLFGSDGRFLVSISADKTARIWDMRARDPNVSPVILKHTDEVTAAALGPDSRWLLTASIAQLNLWDLSLAPKPGTKRLQQHEGDVLAVAMGPTKRWAASSDTRGKVVLWDLDADARPALLRGHDDAVEALAFSPDGQWLASGGRDKLIRVWRLESDNPDEGSIPLTGHTGRINALTWSADGAWLVSASSDGVRLWPVTGRELVGESMALVGHDALVSALAVDRVTGYIATVSYDKTVRVWPTNPHDVADLACLRLGRALTPDEWSKHVGDDYRDSCE